MADFNSMEFYDSGYGQQGDDNAGQQGYYPNQSYSDGNYGQNYGEPNYGGQAAYSSPQASIFTPQYSYDSKQSAGGGGEYSNFEDEPPLLEGDVISY